MADKLEVFGVKELDDFFSTMKRTDQKRIFMDAFRIGAKPIISTAVQNIRSKLKRKSKTRNLEKSVGFVQGKGKTIITAKIGARRFRPYKGYHGHLFDAGTKERKTKKGASRGAMPGSHFFTDAVSTSSEQAISTMQTNLVQSLDKQIQRGLKKQSKMQP